MSKALAERLFALYVSLTDIVKNGNLILGVDEERETLITDLAKLSKRVKEIICSSLSDVIIEGHYSADVVPSNLASYVFVLRRDPDDLKDKLEERGFKEKKILENVAAEILDVCLFNAIKKYSVEKVDEIDMTNVNVEEAVKEILQVLDGQKPMNVGKVDWLGKLEGEGRLEEFLNQD